MASPRVSVITPSFGQGRWLQDNLRSVGCQTYAGIEHIVMDGGSTDETVAVLQAAGDPVRWRSEPDRGQSHAVNKAFAESRGDIIGWLNTDDAYFDCGVVAEVVAVFAANPEVDVVYGHALQATAEGGAIQVLWVPRFDLSLLRALDFIVQPAAFIRRSAVGDSLVDESYDFGMDYELWLRLATTGHGFMRIDRIMSIDRHHPERKSSTMKDSYRENLQRLATEYDMHLGPEWERDRTSFYIRQRLMGARLVRRVRPPFAFTAPADVSKGLWARQVFQRRSRWPEEYR
jgi:glycosyltransferase involved in cell wall biosynthesis